MKRFLPFLLALILMVGLLPSVRAAEADHDLTDQLGYLPGWKIVGISATNTVSTAATAAVSGGTFRINSADRVPLLNLVTNDGAYMAAASSAASGLNTSVNLSKVNEVNKACAGLYFLPEGSGLYRIMTATDLSGKAYFLTAVTRSAAGQYGDMELLEEEYISGSATVDASTQVDESYQLWRLIYEGDRVRIRNMGSGCFLYNAWNASDVNNSWRVKLRPEDGSARQLWQLWQASAASAQTANLEEAFGAGRSRSVVFTGTGAATAYVTLEKNGLKITRPVTYPTEASGCVYRMTSLEPADLSSALAGYVGWKVKSASGAAYGTLSVDQAASMPMYYLTSMNQAWIVNTTVSGANTSVNVMSNGKWNYEPMGFFFLPTGRGTYRILTASDANGPFFLTGVHRTASGQGSEYEALEEVLISGSATVDASSKVTEEDQLWTIVDLPDGRVSFRNEASGYYLTNANTANYSNLNKHRLKLMPLDQRDEQKWSLYPAGANATQTGNLRSALSAGVAGTLLYTPNGTDRHGAEQITVTLEKNGVTMTVPLTILCDGWLIDGIYDRYFRNGEMATGWQEIDGKTYYFTADGTKETGVREIDGQAYEFDMNGDFQRRIYSGTYYILSAADPTKAITPENGDIQRERSVLVSRDQALKLRLRYLGGGQYAVETPNQYRLDDWFSYTDNGNRVHFWSPKTENPYTPNERWRLIENGDGTVSFTMTNEKTVYLTDDNGVVTIWDYTGADTQKWILEPAEEERETGTMVRIASQNVRCADDGKGNGIRLRARRMFDVLDKYDADILCFQEVVPAWMTELHAKYDAEYDCLLKYRKTDNFEGTPIFWRRSKYTCLDSGYFWLSGTPDVESNTFGGDCYRICVWAKLQDKVTGEPFLVYNTHFDFGATQAPAADVILEKIAQQQGFTKYPVFCTADYNFVRFTAGYNKMREQFDDLNWELYQDPQFTFQGYDAPAQNSGSTGQIDFLFYSPDLFRPESYRVLTEMPNGNYVSDHYGIYCELSLGHRDVPTEKQISGEVPNGDYVIRPNGHEDRMAAAASEVRTEFHTGEVEENAVYRFTHVWTAAEDYYVIQNLGNGLFATAATVENGGDLIYRGLDHSDAQKWRLVYFAEGNFAGTYQITSVLNGQVWNVTDNSFGNNQLHLWHTVNPNNPDNYMTIRRVALAPSCGVAGERITACALCGRIHTETTPAMEHCYIPAETTEATCTAAGSNTYFCTICGNTYGETIDPLAHTLETLPAVAPTCDEAGLAEGSRCTVCGQVVVAQETIPALGHCYEDGICTLCQARDEGYFEALEGLRVYSLSMSLRIDLAMNFYIRNSDLEGIDRPYLLVTKTIYDADGTPVDQITEEIRDYTSKSGCQVYQYRNLLAYEMSSEVTVRVCGSYEGQQLTGEAQTFTIRDYAMEKLGKGGDISLETLMINMLNYGAAAQEHFGYNLPDLASRELTEEQQELVKDQQVDWTNDRVYRREPGATVRLTHASLSLKDRVCLNVYIDAGDHDLGDLELTAVCDGKTVTVDGSRFTRSGNGYVAQLSGLSAAQLRSLITVTVRSKTADRQVSDTLQYSVQAYCNEKAHDAGATDTLRELVNRLMKYADSAEDYLLG